MNRKTQALRALALTGIMGGALYTLAGCGGAVSSTVPSTEQTDTNVPFGQRLYVANQTAAGSGSVLRFDQVLEQATGTTVSPDAQFTGFNTLSEVNVDFSGDLLAADAGGNLVDVFPSAEVDSGVVQTAPSTALTVPAPSGVTFDSSHNFYYVSTGGVIDQFTTTNDTAPSGNITDVLLPNPKVLAMDDIHTLSSSGEIGVLFAAGTTATGGEIAIYTEPQNLLNQGDVSTNPNVAHISALAGISLMNPTGIAYDNVHEQLWVCDPGAGYVFIIDNAPNIVASTVTENNVLGASLQIQATSIAVDFSTGVAALMTINSALNPSTVSIYGPGDQLGADEGLFNDTEIPAPSTLILNGVTTPVSTVDDSDH